MIWIAGISLVVGVLILILIPLFTQAKEHGLSAALREQKLRIADDLAEIGRLRASGELDEEDAAARQRALETEARSTFDAERQAKAIAQPKGNQGLVRGLFAALFFILIGNLTAGIYLYNGGWRHLAIGLDESGAHSEGGSPMAQGDGKAPADPSVMVAKLEQRLQENPNDAKGQAMLGRSYLVLERYADAVVTYKKAIELEPENIDSRVGLGVALIRTGATDEASQVFKAILKEDPKNPTSLWFTGNLQVLRKDLAGAKKTFKMLIDVTPDEQKAEQQAQVDQVLEAAQQGQ